MAKGNRAASPSREHLSLLPHRYQVMFALFCVRQVEYSWKHSAKLVNMVNVLENWLDGKSSVEECKSIYADTTLYTFVSYTISYAGATIAYSYDDCSNIHAAMTAAAAAFVAPDPAARRKMVEAQWKHYDELLYIDEIVENTLLGGAHSE
jgi:hypothetical protein